MNHLKPIPRFKNEHEEREFWQTNCISEYVDLTKPVKVSLPNLQRTEKSFKSSTKNS